MAPLEKAESRDSVSGAERAVEIRLGGLGGVELRPTRLFVWTGAEREANERIVSLGSPPRSLDIARKETELHAGPVHVRTLGNPLMTIALAGVHAVRRLTEEGERRLRG